MEPVARLARLVYFNEVLDGHRIEDVRYRIGTLYKLDEARLSRLFSGQRVVFMRGVDLDRAQRHVQRFAKMGARLRMEAMPEAPEVPVVPTPSAARAPAAPPAFAPSEAMALDSTAPSTNFSEWAPTATSVSPEALPTQPAGEPWPSELPARSPAVAATDPRPPSQRGDRPTLEAADGHADDDDSTTSPSSSLDGTSASGHSSSHSSGHTSRRSRRSGSGRSRHSSSSGRSRSRSRSRRGSTSRSIRRIQRAVGIALLVMVVLGVWFSLNTDRVEAWAEAGMRWAGVSPRLPEAAKAPSDGGAPRPMPTIANLPSDAARAAFQNEFAPAPAHKAFAVSPSGAWAWRASQGDNGIAMQQAIAECNVKRTPYTPPCEVINLDGQWIPLQW